MASISLHKQIDHILEIFKKQQSYLNTPELFEIIDKSAIVVEPSVTSIIVEKLIRDKYVFSYTSDGGVDYYCITFEGNLFIGYDKQRILENEEITSASRTLIQDKIYRRRLLWATWSAGIVAALLLLWQVWIWFYPVHKDYPYWLWERELIKKHVKAK